MPRDSTHSVTPAKSFAAFALAYGLCLAVQAAGAYFTAQSVHDWYPTLTKSPLTPPGMWFGIVWTALYFLMALAAAQVWRATGQAMNRPLRWWCIQLLLGLWWSITFFGTRDVRAGLLVLALTWIAVAVTFLKFRRVNRLAGWLMLPLLGWVSFAAYLNFYIFLHN